MASSLLYSVHPTPIGEALIVVADGGLVALDVLEVALGAAERHLERISTDLHAASVPDAAATAAITAQLDEYFAGDRRDFDLALDLGSVDGFARRALEAICTIPYGETASYGEVAILAGSPGAHRAAGSACARTPISIVIPAHRVVRSDGSIGEYGGHPERKRFLLDLEARVGAESTRAPRRPGATV
ncbi:methylated-DNA--[protein]-cysteine S-methyltransferase [Microbacterium sp. VKM Ac-2870]|uniref:methylated-DNA--[protein]-cysteine S-methyltransferase n=1 Tax=Microbacterium sp. VKM Ac-2870 TaxID=2783825 RepID=UPI00188AF9F5|nr:methylated-DNA--[protein]-cysteine S-methyltransferase [Microbacterium sp. VKM Ac-2870]MBF4563146.1 methylated-DNA--[protein]-cysteine S-methyltransferase [Microbacterium sp. VKM Ac-2870]